MWKWVNASSKPTWHPIIYVSYGILHGFKTWHEMDWIRNSTDMAEILRKIAFINVNKLSGKRKSDNTQILEYYKQNKEIIAKQIQAFKPDIVIGYYEILREMYKDSGINRDKKEIQNGTCEYVITEDRLYISVYHPAQRSYSRERYVDDIIKAAKKWEKDCVFVRNT